MTEPRPTTSLENDRSWRIIVALAALLVVGAALGVWLWSRRPSVSPAPREDFAANEEVVDEGYLENEPDGPVVNPTRAGPGALQLRGTVVDTGGLPVSGVQVFAELEPPPAPIRPGGTPLGSAGSAAPPTVIGPAPTSVHTSWRAVALPTDRDGQFVVDGLIDGSYRIVVRGAAVATAEVRRVAVPQSLRDNLRVIVARRVLIAGTVVDGKTPVRNAHVAIRSDAIGGMMEGLTDAAGRFEFRDLPEGGYLIWAWQGDIAANAQRVLRRGFVPAGEVLLRMQSATIVVGRVIDREEGIGVVAAIELAPLDEREAPRYVQSDSDGVFRIEGVPHGRWIADAYAPGYLTAQTVELVAGRGQPQLEVTAGAVVDGRVLDVDGRPIVGASVTAQVNHNGAIHELSASVEAERLRRFDGAVTGVTGVTAAVVPKGAPPARVPVRTATYDPRGELGVLRPIPAIPAIPNPLAVAPVFPTGPSPAGSAGSAALAAAASVTGTTVQASPLRAMIASAQVLPVDPSKSSMWTTDRDGHYRIRAVTAGQVTVEARAAGVAPGSVTVGPAVVGEVLSHVDITLGAGTVVSGRVLDPQHVPVPGALVVATDTANRILGRTSTSSAGEYRLGPFTGAVTLKASAYGYRETSVAVALGTGAQATSAQLAQDLELQPADAQIDGIVEDVRGVPVAGAIVTVPGTASARASVASDGTFRLPNMAAGT
nr:carboxypeptidase regulatory-like domain-containing protein [Kofleriaceae bacterium]